MCRTILFATAQHGKCGQVFDVSLSRSSPTFGWWWIIDILFCVVIVVGVDADVFVCVFSSVRFSSVYWNLCKASVWHWFKCSTFVPFITFMFFHHNSNVYFLCSFSFCIFSSVFSAYGHFWAALLLLLLRPQRLWEVYGRNKNHKLDKKTTTKPNIKTYNENVG